IDMQHHAQFESSGTHSSRLGNVPVKWPGYQSTSLSFGQGVTHDVGCHKQHAVVGPAAYRARRDRPSFHLRDLPSDAAMAVRLEMGSWVIPLPGNDSRHLRHTR